MVNFFIDIKLTPSLITLLVGFLLFIAGIIVSSYFWLLKKRERESCNELLEKKELEKRLGVLEARQEERSRISADLHDDLGAGLTSIHLFSDLAIERPGHREMPEVQRVSRLSIELLNSMNAIIWTMDTSNDSLGNLFLFLRKTALEYFEGTKIHCTVNIPSELPAVVLNSSNRRNIYLIMKETLNNVLKHSEATEVTINISYTDQVSIVITDNGKGFSTDDVKRGNGLHNIRRRVEELGGKLEIDGNNGTKVTISGLKV